MIKFKDCKSKKDKIKYIFSCIITVFITVIIVFSVFFTAFYFIGSCSNKANAAELVTDTTLTITLPNTDFQLNNLTNSSNINTNRYAQGKLVLKPVSSNSLCTFDFYNTLGSVETIELYQEEWNIVRPVSSPNGHDCYVSALMINEYEFGYFMIREINGLFGDELDIDGSPLLVLNDIDLSTVHLSNWSLNFWIEDEFDSNFLNAYFYVVDGTEHTIDVDLFDNFANLQSVTFNQFQFTYIDDFGSFNSFYIDLILPASYQSAAAYGDYNFSLDVVSQVNNSEEAYNNGYQQGINVANAKEYEKGYEDGAEFGYTQGYYDGVDENLSNITPFGVIRHGLTDLFAIELFPGFQLSTLFYIIVGVVLLGIIIKVFYHG